MIKLINILESLIDETFVLSVDNGELKIKEDKPDATCKYITIKDSNDFFAFTLDKSKKIIVPFKREAKFVNKVNDCVLIFKNKDKYICLLIELKSNSSDDYLAQLKSSRNFVRYIFNQINDFFNESITPQYFGVLFKAGKRSSNKNPFKRGVNKFAENNGLKVAELIGNNTYNIGYLKDSLPTND